MKTAVVVVDMVKDNLESSKHGGVATQGKAIVPAVNRLTAGARERGWPVFFATDSFLPGDPLFRGRMKDHSLRGTEGAEVSALLDQGPDDVWLPKRRMSAFFKTDLDQTLRLWQVERVAACGLMTPYCVLTTALDAICHDFYAVMVDDATTAVSDQAHQSCLDLYRKSPLRPLLTVQTVDELLAG
ncbi:MAG: cysteine hydrolase [Desulfarculaceae bacterium]|nr:cysteine hydrolase [Desulfarculaceae bacterium]MCF8070882.1 cysteine hydrolase [Desulfarculaceae bacterium]MCF8100470.1 cysteine hydrolase [Desulfarculaceae bacterium]MCF8118215.1 cysteine hydrolase [Desulfarculaceae bacterium]